MSGCPDLEGQVVASLRTAVMAFNSPVDAGRTTMVLLHLQHVFEMLLEARLQQRRTTVFDKRSGKGPNPESERAKVDLGPARRGDVGTNVWRVLDAAEAEAVRRLLEQGES